MAEESKPKAAKDWEAIERDYRAGVLSVREIANHYGVSHTAINKRAKAKGWDRSLKAKIDARAESLVSRQEVSSQVSTVTPETEREIIASNAEVIANVRMAHRSDIRRSRGLTNKLLDELEALTDDQEIAKEFGEMMRSPDDNDVDRMNDLYQKIISLPSRTKAMKELAETLKTLIGLERQAYDLENSGEQPASNGGISTSDPNDAAQQYRKLMGA